MCCLSLSHAVKFPRDQISLRCSAGFLAAGPGLLLFAAHRPAKIRLANKDGCEIVSWILAWSISFSY
jgi:hypothetical protein